MDEDFLFFFKFQIFQQICFSLVSAVIFLALGGVETWYATGYSHMGSLIRQIGGGQFSGCMNLPNCDILFVVKGWAAAAVCKTFQIFFIHLIKFFIYFLLLKFF